MKNAILIHGMPSKDEYYSVSLPTDSNSHWFPWLSKQLMVRDIQTVAIEMPRPYYPVYKDWCREFERFDVNEQTILVGHSCGGGFLLRWLSEHGTASPAKVILVAPWLGIDFGQSFDEAFFDFTIDPLLTTRTEITLFESTDDFDAITSSIEKIMVALPEIRQQRFTDKGHFTRGDMGTDEFPELLNAILSPGIA